VGAPGLFLIGLVVFLFRGGSTRIVGPPKETASQRQENYLATVRSTLAKQNDLATCKTVIPQLNSHLQKAKEHAAVPLSTQASAALGKEWGLSTDDLEEVASPVFTPLDAYHLERCFLLHDAARALEQTALGGRGSSVKQTPLEQAELAFAWTMRQVRLPQLTNRGPQGTPEPLPLPLLLALRRGWGFPLQRALTFLALLEQFGLDEESSSRLHGALLYCPDEKGKCRLWACGVAIGEQPEALYLFDPRLGLPVPGPDGKGVATLAQACSDRNVLGQLDVDKFRYDVTPQQAKETEVFLFSTLSALAPRMALLQDRLLRDRTWNDQRLPTQVRVRLTADISGARTVIQTALKNSGSAAQVRPWPEGGGILRRYLWKEEGGSGAAKALRQQAEERMVPWQDFTRLYEKPRFFYPEEAESLKLNMRFAAFFIRPLRDPNSPRDMILRGRYQLAAPALVNEQQEWQQMQRRWEDAPKEDLVKGVREWVERATAARAEALRFAGTAEEGAANAREAALWRWRPEEPIAVVLLGAAAAGRGAEVTYQLGLCKQEVAAQLQAKRELAARGKAERPDDTVKAAAAWKEAEGFWKEFTDNYRGGLGIYAVALRRSEAQAKRGDTANAIRTLRNLPDSISDLEKLARLWPARQLEIQLKGK
jgi:hypothetical protein